MNAIEVENLTKYYGDLPAVDHINFSVREGEIFGFLGPNGAGKTTTIRMLTGLSKPTEGRADILGMGTDSRMVEIKKHIGVVPETSNLYDELTARENLLFMGQLYGVPRNLRMKRAEELLKTFGLYERKDSLFQTLSRGMKRALVIASALVHNPQILFLDEPTVGLDVVAARSLRNLIRNLCAQGMTIFLTTHYLEEADLLCNRIAIIVRGRVVKVDKPESLKAFAEEESIIEFLFSRNPDTFIEKLQQRIPQTRMVVDHWNLRIYGGAPATVLRAVFETATQAGTEIESVNSLKPSLEDAFMKITGLSPLVMAVEKGGGNVA